MPREGASALERYGRALLRHARILLPLGAAIGAGVGYLWSDLVFGVLVGLAFGVAWALVLSLHTKERRATSRVAQVEPGDAEPTQVSTRDPE
ncbi:MAG: hypothetical protein JSW65_06470 [Candidatus Bipolaricaulota bacterium]|nr:MAG: hypothetical protein JSW65_06470 [Candidatus Bipolaricaulota bacterium]